MQVTTDLQQICYEQAESGCKSVACCQQTFCKLIVFIIHLLPTGLIQVASISCKKSANEKLKQLNEIDLSCYTKFDWLWKNVEPIIFNVKMFRI